ncbi:MAG: hypothetical protein AW10_02290 [Candidatus Accumulibacter appositus]|uniref:Uncharacterized protein n=1 Tax=Candidatus Accumulibacter appositus TaxID=1454003 RepID=A0A011PRD7_9PROT|nr:MAG: hypothetical protein AW10_02290 [Candidatus Accumulibacter appositus]
MHLDGAIKASGVPELMSIDLPGVFPGRPEAVCPANDAAHNFGARGRALVLDLVQERGLGDLHLQGPPRQLAGIARRAIGNPQGPSARGFLAE